MDTYPHLNKQPQSEPDWFEALTNLARFLRTPEGCPWDREQSARDFAKYAIGEAEEYIEALEQADAAQSEENPVQKNEQGDSTDNEGTNPVLADHCPHSEEEFGDVQSANNHSSEEFGDVQSANNHSSEEFGDALFTLLASAAAAEEEGRFHIQDALQNAHQKMIRRHDHVFGPNKATTPEQAIQAWEQAKAKEREGEGETPSSR